MTVPAKKKVLSAYMMYDLLCDMTSKVNWSTNLVLHPNTKQILLLLLLVYLYTCRCHVTVDSNGNPCMPLSCDSLKFLFSKEECEKLTPRKYVRSKMTNFAVMYMIKIKSAFV